MNITHLTKDILILTYKSYYNITQTYFYELISRRKISVNTRLGTDHHQLIMPPISKDCSNSFLERSFMYAAPCEWNELSEYSRRQFLIHSGRVVKLCYLHNNTIVIYAVITVNYCKCMVLLYIPLNPYLYVHWILDFK